MSRTFHHGKRREPRPLRVRGVRKDPPDTRRLARALISLVQAEAEAEAANTRKVPRRSPKTHQPSTPNQEHPQTESDL